LRLAACGPAKRDFATLNLQPFFVFPKKLVTFKALNTKTKPLMQSYSNSSHYSKNRRHPVAAKPGEKESGLASWY
jgi:hypothetical protein